MNKLYRILLFTLLAVALMCFAACGGLVAQETEAPTEDPNLKVVEYSMVASEALDLSALDAYPNLSRLDLRGSTCYDAIVSYIAAHPQVSVQYDVLIGETAYSRDVSELTLEDGTYEFAQLVENMAYLPDVTVLRLPKTTLSAEELTALMEAYPDITVTFSVMLLEKEVMNDVTELDLSDLKPEQVDDAAAVLPKLFWLTDIQLMNAEGLSDLEIPDVKKLMNAAPNANIHYSFELFGKTLTTADERVEYVKTPIGNDGVEKVREALDIMPECTYFLMDRCQVDNEVMAQLRDDYPDVKIVWRIYYADYSCLTDVEVFRCVSELYDYNSKNLKYCTDVVYLDIGHCFHLSDLSFVSYMPNLKVAIVVDCYAETLEPFAACTNLQWLEIVNCVRIKDISPLANCTNLRGLNMSYSFNIDDLSPLYGLQNMERLFMGRHDLPQEEIDAVREALPDCWVTDHAEAVAWVGFNYSVGWRLDDEHTFADWYLEIKEVFGYNREI